MIFPKFPEKASTIGICAPSAGVGHKLDSFSQSEAAIVRFGYDIKETPSVRNNANPSSDAKRRGEELNYLFADDSISAVYAATGGDYNPEMLPYINSDTLSNKPKWFIGYSDPTNISYYLTTVLDIATIYGTNAGSFDWPVLHEFQENALKILSGDIVKQHSYEYYNGSRDFENVIMDTPVSWDIYLPEDYSTPRSPKLEDSEYFCPTNSNLIGIECSGRLLGGCLDVIKNLIGTDYENTKGFVNKYSKDGILWYFDIFEMNPMYVYLTLLQLKYAGYLANAKAIIFGRIMFPGDAADEDYLRLISKALSDIPFIWGADIGHTKPAMTIINGAIGNLNCKDGKAELTMELK